jgi:chemotaxis protein MotB
MLAFTPYFRHTRPQRKRGWLDALAIVLRLRFGLVLLKAGKLLLHADRGRRYHPALVKLRRLMFARRISVLFQTALVPGFRRPFGPALAVPVEQRRWFPIARGDGSMRVVAWTTSLVLFCLPVLSGCAENSLALRQGQGLQQQQIAMQQRASELQTRANTLDRDNQELESLLAQTRQQSKLIEDQLAATREQLSTASAQLAQLRDEKQLTERQAEALMASVRRRAGAQITANSSLEKNLPALNLPGVEVRADGDVVRVELPAARLFQPGATVLQPVAGTLIDTVAMELARNYPNQTIGIEGHTDNDILRTPGIDHNQLSLGRAAAVYQYLVARGQISANRLFIVGHGSSHPVVSNATAAGKARNSRVELVVYPEQAVAAR